MTLPDQTKPVQYIERTRSWYQGLGYGEPYQWAHFSDVPFVRVNKPLSECTIALVTTAALFRKDKGDQGPGASYNGAAKFYSVYAHPTDGEPDVRISHIAYDRTHTAASDSNSWFPLAALKQLLLQKGIGGISDHFYGLPTNRSQRTSSGEDSPQLLTLLGYETTPVDLVVLVANCPVCHQSVSLAARHLEENGIATVVMGCARDIVEYVGVPRFLFSDFPLGNAAGKPGDRTSQLQTLSQALSLFTSAKSPRTTAQSPQEWSSSHAWKEDYSNINKLSPLEIAQRRAEFDQQKQLAARQKQNP